MLSFSENNRPRYPAEQYAATEDCPWRGRVLRGVVHDDNAYALGGYSGHAGLFGTVLDCYAVVNLLREHYRGLREDYLKASTVRAFFTRQDIVIGSTWALGWDTPSKTGSSAGRYFSQKSVGHLGFTGTSLWMDLEKDVIVILLTNRVHPARANEEIKAFRPQLHDAIMKALS
jgi:CubicO group peptidase (beta-lactamase class C family)